MTPSEIRQHFTPAVNELIDRCRITEEFVDTEQFQVLVATIWGNAVLEPERTGIEEADLSNFHDFLNDHISRVVGEGSTITTCYEFIVSKKGEESLTRQQVSSRHREFLHHFARLILGGLG